MSSPNLAIPLLASSQNNKYITVNNAIELLEAALCQFVTQAMTDANFTFPTGGGSEILGNLAFKMTGTLTAGRNVIVPTNEKPYVFVNGTTGGHAITIKTPSGTGIAIPAGTNYVLLYCDGTNIVALSAASALIAFINLTDAPASYSGAASDLVTVNSGASGLQFSTRSAGFAAFNGGLDSNGHIWFATDILFPVTFPASATNSIAKAGTGATGTGGTAAVYTFSKNGTPFATVTFDSGISGGAVGTWVQASPASFVAGDILELDAPATADTTLANIRIALYGLRS